VTAGDDESFFRSGRAPGVVGEQLRAGKLLPISDFVTLLTK
jgi:hypothetical protein